MFVDCQIWIFLTNLLGLTVCVCQPVPSYVVIQFQTVHQGAMGHHVIIQVCKKPAVYIRPVALVARFPSVHSLRLVNGRCGWHILPNLSVVWFPIFDPVITSTVISSPKITSQLTKLKGFQWCKDDPQKPATLSTVLCHSRGLRTLAGRVCKLLYYCCILSAIIIIANRL